MWNITFLIQNIIVDLKYYCRFEKIKSIWIIVLKVWKRNFDFKNEYIDLKYSCRSEIVFCRFQNITASGNESQFEK